MSVQVLCSIAYTINHVMETKMPNVGSTENVSIAKNSAKPRIKFLDCSRALCMLWIVGIWHMQEYMGLNFQNPITKNVKAGVLATFTLISGYFIGKNKFEGKENILRFFKKRFLRIYPLFFLSCTAFYVMNLLFHASFISSFKQYLLTIAGLSCIITPAPLTVWYVSMLLFFYAITPLIMCWKPFSAKIFAAACSYGIFLTLALLQISDKRTALYFPFYAAGLAASNKLKFSDKNNWILLAASSILFFALSANELKFGGQFMQILICSAFVVFIFEIGKLCTKANLLVKLLNYVCYASMSAYLFHRQILGVTYKIIGQFSVPLAYLIILPATIFLAYGIQFAYDKIRQYGNFSF